MEPRVTAIVTCMTEGERPYVLEGLRSVVAQSLPCAIRLYVREDNQWIDSLIRPLPEVELCRVPPMNSASVRNLGVRDSRSEFVAFLDSDDIWFPEKIKRQVAAADRENVPFVGSDHVLISDDGKRFAYGAAKYLPMTSSWLVARRYMRAFPFNEQIARREDKEWWYRQARSVPRYRLPEFLISYRVRLDSKSAQAIRPNRKVRLSKLRGWPFLSHGLLCSSWVYNRFYRRTVYLPHPQLRYGEFSTASARLASDELAFKGQQP